MSNNTESMPPTTGDSNPKPKYEVTLDDTNIIPASQTVEPPPKPEEPSNAASQEVAQSPLADESTTSQQHMRFGCSLGPSDLPESCRGVSDRGRFQEEEEAVRAKATHGILWLALVNGFSALKVFAVHLISLESLFSIALSVSLTVYVYHRTEDNADFDGSTLDWVLLSFAVITPMSASVGMSFGRRERALTHLVAIRSTMLQLYSAHATWDWKKPGKENTGREAAQVNWLDHSDSALVEILGICHCLSRFLTLPNATRARHRVTAQGRHEADETLSLASKLYGCMLVRFGRLTDLCEVLKAEGLPPNEATRLRQWERMVMEHADGLRMIKLYRTPQALRSFARLFTVFLPPFYAPSYAEIARSIGSLGIGIAFSILTSLALTALFETISQMEDPFLGRCSLDGVDVDCELSSSFVVQCLTMRSHFFRGAKPFDENHVATSTCEKLPIQEFIFVKTQKSEKSSKAKS